MAVILKLSVPVIFAFAVCEVPLLWSSLFSWLRPPYLYDSAVWKNPVGVGPEFGYDAVVMRNPVESQPDILASESLEVYGWSEARVPKVKTTINALEVEDEDDFVISRSAWTLQRRDPMEIPSEFSFATEKWDDKVRVVQTLLFVGGINTLLQTLFGTRLPTVIGGSHAFLVPIISINHDSLMAIPDSHQLQCKHNKRLLPTCNARISFSFRA